MVEAAPSSSKNANQTTPESEKPRVQLELKSSTSPPVHQSKVLEQQNHLDLLKQTVAQLAENQDGSELGGAGASSLGGSAANSTENSAAAANGTKTNQHFETTMQ